MSPDSPSDVDRFLQMAVSLRLLPADTAERLALEAKNRRLLASQLALQKGLLTASQVDIVETLLRPDDVAPGYQLLNVLGHGGMGVVYRARQRNLNRIVAVKTVLVSQMGETSVVARFENEVQAVARLAHPHIVAAYDFGQHEGRLYFVMEYVEGEDVQRLIRRSGPLDEALAWSIVRQAAAGLAHAAQAGVVHRDIKPANLLLVAPPAGFPLPAGVPLVKIADFGLARLTTEADERTRLTSSNHTIGSPHYMSPEQLRGEAVDLRSDIYALGCTAYHMLAGRPPLSGKTVSQIAALKLSDAPPSVASERADVSPGSVDLVRRMMATDAANRPQTYEALIERIDRLETGAQDERTVESPLSMRGDQHSSNNAAKPTVVTHAAAVTDRAVAVAQAVTQVSPVVETASVDPQAFAARNWPVVLLVAAVTILAIAGAMAWFRHVPQRPLVPTGQQVALFDGHSLDGWTKVSGGWGPTRNDEGSPVLAGTSGGASRTLPAALSNAPAESSAGYRLTVLTRLHAAKAAEVQFGFSPSGERLCVRLTPEGSVIGRRAGAGEAFTPIGRLTPFERPADGEHDVKIERQPVDWWVLVNGKVIGAVAANGSELSEMRLVADGGEAWFSDISAESLLLPGDSGVERSPPTD